MRQGNLWSQVVGAIPSQSGSLAFLSSFSFPSMFWHINIHHMPCQTYHWRASFLCFCGVGKQRVQLLPSDSSFPCALAHMCNQTGLCQKPGIHELSQPLQWASSYRALLQIYILYLTWHPLLQWVAPWYDWGKTDRWDYLIGKWPFKIPAILLHLLD